MIKNERHTTNDMLPATNYSRRQKRAQSEMMGFVIIIIMIVVIGMVFLSFSSKDEKRSDSLELKSFVQSVLGYTTECQDIRGSRLPLRKVIYLCGEDKDCYSGQNSCKLMNETLSTMLENSWKIGEEWPTKGYSLQIFGEKKKVLNITQGIRTNNARSAGQTFESGIVTDFVVYN